MNKKKLILVAEDDVSIRTVLSTQLENKHELKLTDNCAQLWNWVSDGLGDLIILDVIMPDENGLDLIPKIKEIRPDIKIIINQISNQFLSKTTSASIAAIISFFDSLIMLPERVVMSTEIELI